jgi:macrolide transport system ATP-binding/permease protein
MASATLRIRDVEFSYPSSPSPVIRNLSATLTPGFTGVIGPNGSGKTTFLQLAVGLLVPESGGITVPPDSVYCSQRTDEAPASLALFLDDTGAAVYRLRWQLGIEDDWLDRWHRLSHGERKRAQIAVALWLQPAVLALDEPTNHLDAQARDQLRSALSEFSGIGLLVSHDRTLLDGMCSQCLWLGADNNRLYPGGYSAAQAVREQVLLTAERTRTKARRERDTLKRERIARAGHVSKANRARSKSAIAVKDHSAKAAVNLARNTDSGEGQRLRQLDGRMHRAEQALEHARVEKRYTIGFEIPGTVSSRDWLLQLDAGALSMGKNRTLQFPALELGSQTRVAITGGNGLGKSTLLRHLRQHLNLDADRLLYMPQELTAEQGATTLAELKSLPRDALGHAMNVVSCLGSRPGPLLDSVSPSPGELRKLLLALGMARRPQLLIMDEPTNHLDLPSVEALEGALAQCHCAMVLVSHDERFLNALATQRWHILAAPFGARLVME